MDKYVYEQLGEYHYNCDTCPTRCDGISKLQYQFGNDSAFSEKYETALIGHINRQNLCYAQKSTTPGYPDLEIFNQHPIELRECVGFIEVKVQQRTFMTVRHRLPQANLYPSETVALNQSDLLRYFEIKNKTNLPLYLVWILLNRPCVLGTHSLRFFHQEADVLAGVYGSYTDKRRFRRRSGEGDIVDGVHKGVVVNYHFSLKELIPGLPFGLSDVV